MKLTDLYLKPEEIQQAAYIRPGNDDGSLTLVSKASANHAVKKVVEWLLAKKIDCYGGNALILSEDWQALKKLVEELDNS